MSENKERVKLLVPVDFSDLTEKVLPTAQYLAQVYDAEVHLLHVLEVVQGPLKVFGNFDEDKARTKALELMDKVISETDGSTQFHKIIKMGKPYRKILEAANEINANAIVMGTHGASGMRELMVGTNAARVIRQAKCPVLTLSRKPDKVSFEKILLPIDLTRESGEKLKLGIEFAKNFGAQLILLTMLVSNNEEDKKTMRKRMAMAIKHIKEHHVPVESITLIGKGNRADQVIEYAHEVGADLICIMTQQELEFKETLLGSHASHVVNHSDVPVFSIRPVKEYRERTFSDAHFG